ncbi:S41 family peptidase [Thermovenabulum gondwanense]|uniref:Carboxy-terminal processing protease CtpB n=1 Tax=Thermovenabulum gondwanense TaxID=520767 RepID=A0A162MJA3_9FIRM|nr:S41 family peptidase [Thermovenabulum gondwanense]KYO66349.1 Carboxy-terminal processing protease CtpB [Thermovenabulum gondwanense]
MKLKLFKRAVLAVIIVFFLFVFSCPVTAQENSDNSIPPEIDFLKQLADFIESSYPYDVNRLDIIKGAIKGMVESLNDPYSEYFSPEDLKDFEDTTTGVFGGIGVVITSKDNFITVVTVLENSPAMRAGIKPNDRIVEVDGQDIRGISSSEASKLIRGKEGTTVRLGIMREGQKDVIRLNITREIIKVNPIEYKILEEGIGYIKISEFNENTSDNVAKAIDFFKKSNVKYLILDLRNNPGGLLDEAVEVAKYFVPRGPIVKVIYKNGAEEVYQSDRDPEQFNLSVLVNGGSASAAEILAGAIKDRNAGIVLGEKTFGKATVQRVIDLGELGGIKLTVARYVTPNGTDINKTGIKPDVEIKMEEEKKVEFTPLKGDKPLKIGSIGLDVMGLQERLAYLNILPLKADGIFGPKTKKAVETFQRMSGLKVNGIVDVNFIKKLNSAIEEKINKKQDVQLNKTLEIIKAKIKKAA